MSPRRTMSVRAGAAAVAVMALGGACTKGPLDVAPSAPESPLPKSGSEGTTGPGPGGSNRFPRGSAPPPLMRIASLEPIDGSTSTAATIPRLIVDSGRLDEATIESLKAATSVHTWPDLARVSTTFEVSTASGDSSRTDILLHPASPLAEQWYVVRVTSLPSSVSWAPLGLRRSLPDGSSGAIFHTGSDPRLWGLRVCEKGSEARVVYLDFSERVVATAGLTSTVVVGRADRKDAVCRVVNDSVEKATGGETVGYACSSLDPAVGMTVAIGSGLRAVAPGGRPVTATVAGGSLNFTVSQASLVPWGDCKMYRP